jgi:uncharacterized membrane protein YgcG
VTTIARRTGYSLAALFLVGAASVVIAAPASAADQVGGRASAATGVDDFTFSNFSADYYLDRDASGHSTLKTVEKLTADFPSSDQNKGIVRVIPDDYLGGSLQTKFVSVSDSNGVTKPYSVKDDGTETTVETGTDDYVHGKVTYTLTYTQRDVAGSFADTGDDEFYWDTNGTSWNQPFEHLEARVHVAADLVSALTGHNACYQGAERSTDRCDIATVSSPTAAAAAPTALATPGATVTATSPAAPAVFVASATNVEAGENMTVAIGFTEGTFTGAPSADTSSDASGSPHVADTVWGEIVGAILLLIALAAIPFALIRRFATGQRDAKGRGTIIPQYDIPAGLNLIEAGNIVKRQAPAIPAQIVSFAVRGKLRILDYPVTDSGATYTLELTTADGLDPEETLLLSAFFPNLAPGETFEVLAGAVESSQIRLVQAAVQQRILQKAWRIRASSRSGFLTALALIGLLIVDLVIVVITGTANAFANLAVPATLVAIVIAFAVAYRGFVLTQSGADQRDYLVGMRLYLTVAEEDRMRMLQSATGAERVDYGDKREVVKLYEKLLPFAVLFGVEDSWSRELALHYTDSVVAPDWYVSSSAFNAAIFVGSLSSLSGAVSSSVIPVSTGGGSGFGGSFGGGFSGGGGGGGGGGGR